MQSVWVMVTSRLKYPVFGAVDKDAWREYGKDKAGDVVRKIKNHLTW
jgi:hypothetical protein